MKITKLFEQKFLLGWGRHLWNVVGVSGFVAVLTGIILFGNSLTTQTPKSKMKFIGKRTGEKSWKKLRSKTIFDLMFSMCRGIQGGTC